MWMGSRISHRPISCLRRRPTICLKLATCAALASSDLSFVSKESDGFLSWLQRKAGVEISSKLTVGTSNYGRSLFASQSIQAGDCILKVPFSVQISPDNILPEIKSLLNDDIGNVAKLALVLLIEQRRGQESEWAMYINSLPHFHELHSTVLWDKYELDMIQQSTTYLETRNHRTNIEKDFMNIKTALEHFPQLYEDISLEGFMHAYALVASRAWGTSKVLSLIPFADFMNHDGTSDAVLLSDEDKEISEVIADRDYTAGEQVFMRYGKFSNATLVLDFGFTFPNNMYDQVEIRLAVHQHDALCTEKVELCHKHSMQTVMCTKDGLKSYGITFTIKEVKSVKGKGRGIPQSLRAFARVLVASMPQELDAFAMEAAQNDGRLARRQLKNVGTEIAAHLVLLSEITHMIREYDASIKSLGIVNTQNISTNKVQIRRQMARDLLAGELRVLKSASAWLIHYCSSLSASMSPSS